jgi:hypothetical protein
MTHNADFTATVLKDLQLSSERVIKLSFKLLLLILVYLYKISDFAWKDLIGQWLKVIGFKNSKVFVSIIIVVFRRSGWYVCSNVLTIRVVFQIKVVFI